MILMGGKIVGVVVVVVAAADPDDAFTVVPDDAFAGVSTGAVFKSAASALAMAT